MAALTSAQHVGLFMFLWITGSVAAGESLERKSGEDVILRCNSVTDAAITKLEWIRPELEEDYVFFFRENRLIESFQDPRYRGRVDLKDPEMKNGDASVLLKNVNTDDTGTYECRVQTHSNNRRKRNVREFVRSVNLTVSERPEQPEGPRGHVGWGVGLGLLCLVVVVGGGGGACCEI
ncbi:coxsackievirus and adenovirus receptor homolog [Gymnodraco acuticeps]|uniref:Coxsackievirus and adenovirus receptor homolog n=1 Tax=Gymnodraco acuticeps TaxID=8218 RepID=A0A6P8TRE8_GYMAC|nr:coxsackievirus and adenovirus receptor homolog [Gymnodraco acuticeps]